MTKETKQHHMVYTKRLSVRLIGLGHKCVGTLPNPQKPWLTSWIFEVDDTFFADLDKMRKER